MEDNSKRERGDLFAKSVRAGKRTYFFDVRSTRGGQMYLTITESKKVINDEASYQFKKHKIFLYKEDFENFMDGLQEAVEYINKNDKSEGFETKERKREYNRKADNENYY